MSNIVNMITNVFIHYMIIICIIVIINLNYKYRLTNLIENHNNNMISIAYLSKHTTIKI